MAMGSDMSEAMLGVGSLVQTWLGQPVALTWRLEELLPRSRGPCGPASLGWALSSTPGFGPPPMTGVDGAGLLSPAPGDEDTWDLTDVFLPPLETEGRFT